MIFELFVLFLIIICTVRYLKNKIQSKDMPPGPWGFPFLGHLPLLGDSPHKKLLEWKKTYGPIMSVQFGSFDAIVLNDAKSIKEAFSLPSFSGRPLIKPFVDGTDRKGIIFGEGPGAAEQRQFFLHHLKDFGYGRKVVEDKILEEISAFIKFLGTKTGQPLKVNHMFNSYIVNGLWSIVNGDHFEHDDPQIQRLVYLVTDGISRSDEFLEKLALFIPLICKLVPEKSGYLRKVGGFKEVYAYMDQRITERKLTWVKGQPRDLTDAYLDKVAETDDVGSTFHESHEFQKISTGDLFMATVDTSANTLEWFVNLIARHPKIQKRLQDEIDEVVGPSRQPTVSDRRLMPFSEAVANEILRLVSVVPLSLFHRTMADVEFRGYKIPKNTMVVANIYAAHHDKDAWGDPEIFRPDRFIGEDGRLKKNDSFCGFSYGKRACPGEALGRDQLFLFITSMSQKFDISLPPGAPEPRARFGITLAAETFQGIFTERKRDI